MIDYKLLQLFDIILSHDFYQTFCVLFDDIIEKTDDKFIDELF